MNIEVRGTVDPRAVEQLRRCAEDPSAVAAAICADGHVGYSQPVGGVVAYLDKISPSGVGYDIGCGNKAVRTDIPYVDIGPHLPWVMDEIVRRISFGVGRKNDEPADHDVLDAIAEADFVPQRGLFTMAADQLGTIGSGNHYVDLFKDEDEMVWIGVHFGSRGFGHRTASGFLAMAQGQKFNERVKDGEMDSPPVLFDVGSELGDSYIAAMELAGDYAYAGRDLVVEKVLDIIGAESTFEVHNHHNFAWEEEHFGNTVWVVRKGCTPAFPGQFGFVGATMGDESVILCGQSSDGATGLLNSTVHGAGRVMSRTAAAGKTKRRKHFGCPNRGCSYTSDVQPGKTNRGGPTNCPEHGLPLRRFWVSEQVSEGLIDWPATLEDMHAAGIELRGAGPDEAPGAYKRLDEVLAAHRDTIEIVHHLKPIGVAMAGRDTYDPFKD